MKIAYPSSKKKKQPTLKADFKSETNVTAKSDAAYYVVKT